MISYSEYRCHWINFQFSEKWHLYFSSTLEQMVRVKDSDGSAFIEFGIGESFRNMDEMFETIEIGDQVRDLRTSPYSVNWTSRVRWSLKRQKQKLKISKVKRFSLYQMMASLQPLKNGEDWCRFLAIWGTQIALAVFAVTKDQITSIPWHITSI